MVAEQPRKGSGSKRRRGKKSKSKKSHIGLTISEEARLRADLRGTGTGNLSRVVECNDSGAPIERIIPPMRGRALDDLPPWPPSEPWIDAQIRVIEDTAPDGTEITYRFHDAKSQIFPPGAQDTGMARCPFCGRITPRNSLEEFRGWRRPGTKNQRRKDEPGGEVLLNGDRHRQKESVDLCMDHKAASIHMEWGHSPSATAIQTLRDRKVRLEQQELLRDSYPALQREIDYVERTGKVPPERFSMPRQKAH